MKVHLLALSLFALSLISNSKVNALPEVSHDDIRDAILSLVSVFRDNSDKLERHEFRERQLGEQLKKALAGLDKRYKSQDQNMEKLAALMLRFDDRMKGFEILMKQRDERERIQLQKSFDAVENVQTLISKMIGDIQAPIKDNTATYTVQGSDREYIQSLEASLTSKMDALSSRVEELQAHLQNSPANSNTLDVDQDIKNSIKETERILQRFNKKVEESPKGNGNWHLEFSSALQGQKQMLGDILEMAMKTSEEINGLPNKIDFLELNNVTQDSLQEMKEELMSMIDQGVTKLRMKIDDSFSGVGSGQEEVIKAISELQSMGENLYSDVSKSYEQLLKEFKSLSKLEQVMIQTADNVLDTKRRIEYGVHQILLEVGDLVKIQGKNLNLTINQRFNDIEGSILDNQTGALTNLTSKIETEISQVWRQIGIMYQQLTASANTLDRLQQQTDNYVNGSVKTMDSMEGKVSKITNRMTDVDENLNYLLGKLSLVTSEFNQIKSGLASALDNIRSNFLDVQSDIREVGPGPRPIDNDVDSMISQSGSSS